jgi:DNA polymerase IV
VVPAATILHADLDAFSASVEQRDDPALRGRPVLVGGGVVLAASYEARAAGVRSAMSGYEARRRCPHAIVVPVRFDAYVEASKAVFEIFEAMTPLVEPISIDEAFLDVSGALRLLGDPVDIATTLRRRVREEVGLPLSVGIATTKFLAKVASAQAKPDGLLLVPPGGELAFLHPLPVEALWGVGPATRDKLVSRGVRTVGDLAGLPDSVLGRFLGGAVGRHLRSLAWNVDPRRIETGRRDKTIGSQRALGPRRRSSQDLRDIVLAIADRVTARLRKAERLGRTVIVTIRFGDMQKITRSRTLIEPTDDTSVIATVAEALLTGVLDAPDPDSAGLDAHGSTGPPRTVLDARGVTLVGVRLSGLCRPDAVQLGLPFDATGRGAWRAVDDGVDRIRARFGRDAVARAATLHTGPHHEVPGRPSAVDAP